MNKNEYSTSARLEDTPLSERVVREYRLGESIKACCANYADWHAKLFGKKIMDRMSGCEYPRFDFFWNKTKGDKEQVILGTHPNYYLTKKNT